MSKEAMLKGFEVGDPAHGPYSPSVDIRELSDKASEANHALILARRRANIATKIRENLEEAEQAKKELNALNDNRGEVERLGSLLKSLQSKRQDAIKIAEDRDKKALALKKEAAKEDKESIKTDLGMSNALLKDALKSLRKEIGKVTGAPEKETFLSSIGIATDEKALLKKASDLSSELEDKLSQARKAIESARDPKILEALAAKANPDKLGSSRDEERTAIAMLQPITVYDEYFSRAELLIKSGTIHTYAANYANSPNRLFKADANYNLGVLAEQVSDFAKAITYYHTAYEAGSQKAAYALGTAYERNSNLPEALKWYVEAAKEDNKDKKLQADASLRVGKLLAKRGDHTNAAKYFQKAANTIPEAAFELALCYQDGIGLEKNQAEAIKYYTIAAEAGHKGAANNLGVCYEYGLGVEQNLPKAMDLYQQVSYEIVSEIVLGNKGRLQTKLDDLALENTDPGKQYELAKDFEKRAYRSRKTGIGDAEKLEENAFILYQKSAEAENPDAIYKTARCYQYGLGVERNPDKAIELYKKVKEDQGLDYQQANYALGKIYQIDIKNDKMAAQYFKIAADLGDPYASHELARYYQIGIEGFEQNNKEAARLYQFAIDMVGHKQARAELDKLPHDSYSPGQTPTNLEAARKELASSIRKGAVEDDAIEGSDAKNPSPSKDDDLYKMIIGWHNEIIEAAHEQCKGRSVEVKQEIINNILTKAITKLWDPIIPSYKISDDVKGQITVFSNTMANNPDGILSYKRKGEGEGLRKFKKFGDRVAVALGVSKADKSLSDFMKHQYRAAHSAGAISKASVLGAVPAPSTPHGGAGKALRR